MTTYATTADIETELGRVASSFIEVSQWEAWLARVERTIVRRFARAGLVLADEITAGVVTAQDVADVEVAAVVRKVTNPAGLTSVTRTLDDGTLTTRREGAEGDDPLDVTDAEWAGLLPRFEHDAWSTRPGFDPDCATGTWTTPTDYSWT